jgi:hypothetical protein
MIKRMLPVIVFLVFFAGMTAVEFSSPDMPDNDGFYHIKLAYLMRTESLKPDFPYLPLTILNEREFYDHHFLFHVALMPFTFGDLRVGAKWAAVLFSALGFLAVWYLFYRQRIPLGWLWAIALLGLSDPFLYRMSVTRAQSLSLGMLALGMVFLLENKHKSLAVLSFLYVWMYDAFPLLFALGALHFLSVALTERRFDFRPLLFIAAGLVAGMLINPYFPDNLIFSWRHMLPKLTETTAVNVGNEWYPYDTGQILRNSFPALAAFAFGVLAVGNTGRKMDLRTTFSLLLSLLFGLMFFRARRFVEYFPPFTLIFTAFAFAPLLSAPAADAPPRAESSRWRVHPLLQRNLALILLLLASAAGIARTIPRARNSVSDSQPYGQYRGASIWLAQNTPAGSRVFQTDWDDFPRLFFYNTHNTYLVGLDPTYLQLYDRDLYALWVNITHGDVVSPSFIIADTFGCQYVHTDLSHEDFLEVAYNDPWLKEVYRDKDAVLFEVLAR